MLEVTKDQIERNKGAAIAKVHIAVNGWSANIHAHMFVFNRHEWLFLST